MKKTRILILLLFIAISSFAQLDTRSIIYKGRYDIYNKKFQDAIKKFNSVIVVKPDLVEPYFFRGIAKYELKDYKGAEMDLLKVIDMNPFYISAYHYIGIVYGSMEDYNIGLKYLNKALELSPYDASIFMSRGITKMQMKNIDAAIEDFNAAMKLNNQLPELYLNKGIAFMIQDKYDDAITQFNKAIKLNVFFADAFARRGIAQMELKDKDAAIKDLTHALKLDSKNTVFYYWRAHVYYENMEFDNAIADYDKVIEMNPNNALVYFNRAVIRADIGLYNDAIADYNKVIELNPENVIPYYNKASINMNNKQYREAIKDLSDAISVFPEFSQAYEMRAYAKSKIGDDKGSYLDNIMAEKMSDAKSKLDTNNFKKLLEFDDDFYSTKAHEKVDVLFGDIVFTLVDKNYQEEKEFKKYYYDFLEDINSLIPKGYKLVISTKSNNFTDEKLQEIKQSINEIPIDKRGYIYFVKAIIEKELKNYNQAVENLDILLISNKNFAPAEICYANILHQKRDLDNIISDCKINVEIDGINSEYNTKDKEGYYTSIVDAYSKISDKNEIVNYNLGNLYSELNQPYTAIFYYNKAIESNKDLSYAYFNRGLNNIKIKLNEKACLDFSRAGELGLTKAYNLIEKFCSKQ